MSAHSVHVDIAAIEVATESIRAKTLTHPDLLAAKAQANSVVDASRSGYAVPAGQLARALLILRGYESLREITHHSAVDMRHVYVGVGAFHLLLNESST